MWVIWALGVIVLPPYPRPVVHLPPVSKMNYSLATDKAYQRLA